MKKQLERMHKHFGRAHAYRCGTCCNFVKFRYRAKPYQKCLRYGCSHSLATDWVQAWPACGIYNKPLPDGERPLIEYVDRRRAPEGEVPGQIGMEALM